MIGRKFEHPDFVAVLVWGSLEAAPRPRLWVPAVHGEETPGKLWWLSKEVGAGEGSQ